MTKCGPRLAVAGWRRPGRSVDGGGMHGAPDLTDPFPHIPSAGARALDDLTDQIRGRIMSFVYMRDCDRVDHF
jgi:hypothetical protein